MIYDLWHANIMFGHDEHLQLQAKMRKKQRRTVDLVADVVLSVWA